MTQDGLTVCDTAVEWDLFDYLLLGLRGVRCPTPRGYDT